MTYLGYLLAVLIGLSLGLLGGGGSILTVPVFVYVLDYGVKESVAMSLVVVGLTSLFGVYHHWRVRNVNFRAALAFGPTAMVGSVGGAELALHVSGAFQLAVFGAVMLAAAGFMYFGQRLFAGAGEEDPVRRRPLALVGLLGAGVGMLTGLVGVGGGFLYVPALVLLGGLGMKEAVGTSLILITLSCVSSFLRYLGTVPLDWPAMGIFTLLAFVGVVIGTALVKRVSQAGLRRAFALFLVVMGTFVLVKGK
ncbi:MAG: sulfite exporter TauE/SafE family protein [Gemmatimonadales bacterium]